MKGVSLLKSKTAKGTEINFFHVQLMVKGERYRKSFSIEKYGKEKAYVMAVQYRRKLEDELLYGDLSQI